MLINTNRFFYYSLIFICFAALFLNGCSLFNSARTPVDGEKNQVTQAQYDELLKRYELLKKEVETKADDKFLVKEDKLNEQMVNQSNLAQQQQTSIETVDALSTEAQVESKVETAPSSIASSSDQEIKLLEEGIKKFEDANYNLAILAFSKVKDSAVDQVQVRSRQYIGKSFLLLKDYKKALIVFEDVINHYAYSSVVIESLQLAVICSDRLGDKEKKEKFEKILKDVFKIS